MNEDQESQNQEAEVQEQVEQVEEKPQNSPEVGFPLSSKPKEKSSKAGLIILIVVALLGVGIFLLTKRAGEKEIAPTETPTVTSSPLPTASAEPIDRAEVSIEVQNGTGISGEAAYLQGQLRSLGYTDITVGNASSQDNEATTVTFKSGLNKEVVDEITAKLETLYEDVTTKTSSTQTKDVVIITGLRKGQTPRPSATATPKASPTATSTSTPSPSPTSGN
ncbi:LytR C-terminal domain-containing protein [Candidatus Woesebacteria bacterium]|nr:LytR C-terminal domain-containing protein [Candidatus Woesebacteria bacterium]